MLIANIDEDRCIGCGICLEECPFDAIIGAVGQMHTVIVNECIGCNLCVNPCPIDCINLIALANSCLSKQQKVSKARLRKLHKIQRLQIENAIFLNNKDQVQQELANILATRDNKHELNKHQD